jgi:hypothetical protein
MKPEPQVFFLRLVHIFEPETDVSVAQLLLLEMLICCDQCQTKKYLKKICFPTYPIRLFSDMKPEPHIFSYFL